MPKGEGWRKHRAAAFAAPADIAAPAGSCFA
jgi:hypothetical protein